MHMENEKLWSKDWQLKLMQVNCNFLDTIAVATLHVFVVCINSFKTMTEFKCQDATKWRETTLQHAASPVGQRRVACWIHLPEDF